MNTPQAGVDTWVLESARVAAIDTGGVWLETTGQHGCANCRSGRGCGVSMFQRLFRLPQHRIYLPTEEVLSVGDHVVVGLSQRALLLASVWLYLVPLLGLLVGALVADMAFGQEALTVAGGVFGLLGMLAWVRGRQRRQARSGRFFPALQEVTFRQAAEQDG